MKKITCLVGSPRLKGNSTIAMDWFMDTAAAYGAELKRYELNSLEYCGCQECMICKTRLEKCCLQDDLEEVLQSVSEADVLTISSGIFWGDVTAQTKGCIDRFYSFYLSDYITNPKITRLLPGKKLILILSQAGPDESVIKATFERYSTRLKRHGFDDNYLIPIAGTGPGISIHERNDVKRMIAETVQTIM